MQAPITSRPSDRGALTPAAGVAVAERPGGLRRMEVAVAVNLDPPYRHAQDIFWLEVMAADARHAVALARQWTAQGARPFESTGLVRDAGPHPDSVGFDHRGVALTVHWNTPLSADVPAGTVVRDPVTGLRVGFVAHPRATERWLPARAAGSYVLLTRKPTSSSDPAGLAPLCERP